MLRSASSQRRFNLCVSLGRSVSRVKEDHVDVAAKSGVTEAMQLVPHALRMVPAATQQSGRSTAVFLIQNEQNRDSAAIQAKLDELIRSHTGADNFFVGIEHLTDRELEVIVRACEDRARRERALLPDH